MDRYENLLYWTKGDPAFIAEVQESSGCMTRGDNLATALRNLNNTMRFWIGRVRALEMLIQEPKGVRLTLA